MVPDGQKVWTDGQNGRTQGRRQNYIPPTSSGDNNMINPANPGLVYWIYQISCVLAMANPVHWLWQILCTDYDKHSIVYDKHNMDPTFLD